MFRTTLCGAFVLCLLCGCGDDGSTGASSSTETTSDLGPASPADDSVPVLLPFQVTVGGQPLSCGASYAGIGTAGSTIEARDVRFFVHGLELLDADGLGHAVTLDRDGRWQREDLALLDFTSDNSPACADRGTAATRTFVSGRVAEGEYVGVRFRVGVPAEYNHLDGPVQAPPLNEPGMWWSWSAGFRHVKVDVVAETGGRTKERYAFHAGALGCASEQLQGPYVCQQDMLALVQLEFTPGESAVELDLARLLGDDDLSAGRGCMGASNLVDYTDAEGVEANGCEQMYGALGLVMDPSAQPVPPVQTAFRTALHDGGALEPTVAPEVGALAYNDPTYWPHPDFQRSPALDEAVVSSAGEARSHAPGDARHGSNCLRCHQEYGPGKGRFVLGGTVFHEDGTPYTGGGSIEVGVGQGHWGARTPQEKITDFELALSLPIDANGQFFTTETSVLDYAVQSYNARVVSADGELLLAMAPRKAGACNTCHSGSFRISVPGAAE